MSKNVLIIGGSPRKDRNSELLCKEFARGAETAGNHVEYISLSGKKNRFLHGMLCVRKRLLSAKR